MDELSIEERITRLERRMDALTNSVDLLRKEIEGAFYGANRDPEHLEQMKKVGLLDRIDNIARILEERLPGPETSRNDD